MEEVLEKSSLYWKEKIYKFNNLDNMVLRVVIIFFLLFNNVKASDFITSNGIDSTKKETKIPYALPSIHFYYPSNILAVGFTREVGSYVLRRHYTDYHAGHKDVDLRRYKRLRGWGKSVSILTDYNPLNRKWNPHLKFGLNTYRKSTSAAYNLWILFDLRYDETMLPGIGVGYFLFCKPKFTFDKGELYTRLRLISLFTPLSTSKFQLGIGLSFGRNFDKESRMRKKK